MLGLAVDAQRTFFLDADEESSRPQRAADGPRGAYFGAAGAAGAGVAGLGSATGGMQKLMPAVKDEQLERAIELLKGSRILRKG